MFGPPPARAASLKSMTFPREAPPSEAAPSAAPGLPAAAPRPSWLTFLDSFLPARLRGASSRALTRARVLVGASCFLLLFDLLALFLLPRSMSRAPLVTSSVLHLVALTLIRRGSAPRGPALLLCLNLSLGLVWTLFPRVEQPYLSTHAVIMLLPALAVYLVGARLGLVITALFGLSLVLRPLYATRFGALPALDEFYWPVHLCAAIALGGAWLLSWLHSSSRDAAQASLEHAMRVLHESEGRLSSILESTEDLVCLLDAEGRILLANPALRQVFHRAVGRELEPGMRLDELAPPGQRALWNQRLAGVNGGQRVRFEEEYRFGEATRVLDICLNPISGEDGRVARVTLFARDITARRDAETRLTEMHRTLVDVSRQAGMAEVATGLLHNVGNTLNSVNISTGMVADQLRKSRVLGLTRVAALLREHTEDLSTFLTQDAQGRKLPGYVIALADELAKERDGLLDEVRGLSRSVEHIKSIVSMQQKHARAAGAVDQVPVPQLIDEALRLHAVSFERLGIRIEREYAQVPPLLVDRHQLLQILVNLLSNARHALVESAREDKRLHIRVRLAAGGQGLAIEVADNGVGVAPDVLPRLFSQGFTTKKTGHGFGLHISALAAAEMKGRLTCQSAGRGEGATFTLELPLASEEVPS